MIRSVLQLLVLFSCLSSYAQTNISGVINNYIDVTAVDYPGNFFTVSNATGFSIGDKVLLIQMKGATISETDDANYGTITNYNDAGNYEINVICDIQGNDVIFEYDLLNTYTPSGLVQMVSIPTYTNALISGGDLTCAAWDGTTGGVLILETTSTLDFGSQNIDVVGRGFRGYTATQASNTCSYLIFGFDASYYQPITNGDVLSRKGEGIAEFITGKESGRGPQANGGGGGNNHNNGGGGGGNYGYGGAGGQRIASSSFTCGSVVGVNSKDLSTGYGSNKIFLGGASGSGQGNNTPETNEHGQNGAGIVIIIAGTVDGNGQAILANGIDIGTASYDGAGGGSAGGTVLLDVANFSTALNIDVGGGDGGDIFDTGGSNCNGPGGGGGGGLAWYSLGSVPGSVTTNFNGGTAGQILNTGQGNCTVGSTNGAVNGQNGAELIGLTLNTATSPFAGCSAPLPNGIIDFQGFVLNENDVQLTWNVDSEVNIAHYIVFRSRDGHDYTAISDPTIAQNVQSATLYSTVDPGSFVGNNFYKLEAINYNGNVIDERTIVVSVAHTISKPLIVPNPVTDQLTVILECNQSGDGVLEISDLRGNRIASKPVIVKKGVNSIGCSAEGYSPGAYLLRIVVGQDDYLVRFIVAQ